MALRVDDADVGGPVFGAGEHAAGVEGEVAGLGLAHGALGVDEAGASGEVAGSQQGHRGAQRRWDEAWVGDVDVAVGVGEPFGLGDQVYCLGGGQAAVGSDVGRRVRGEVGLGEHGQGRGDGGAPRGRWRHAAHGVVAVRAAHGVARDGLVSGEVVEGHGAGGDALALGADLVDDRLGDRAGVERVGALGGHGGQGLGVGGVGEARPGGFPGVAVEEVPGGVGVAGQVRGGGGDGFGQAWADLEAVVGQQHRGVEQVAPLALAVVGVGRLEQAEDAGHADGPPAAPRVGLRCGGVVGRDVPEVVDGGGGGRGLPAVVRFDLPGLGVVVHEESAAAKAGGLRLDQPEDGLGGDQGVGGGTAVGEDLARRPGRQRVRGGDRVRRGGDGPHPGAEPGGDLGVQRDGPLGAGLAVGGAGHGRAAAVLRARRRVLDREGLAAERAGTRGGGAVRGRRRRGGRRVLLGPSGLGRAGRQRQDGRESEREDRACDPSGCPRVHGGPPSRAGYLSPECSAGGAGVALSAETGQGRMVGASRGTDG